MTCTSACSSDRRVAGGRITSSSVRCGTTVSTTRRSSSPVSTRRNGVRHRISVPHALQPSQYGRGRMRVDSLFTAPATSDKIVQRTATIDRRASGRVPPFNPSHPTLRMCVSGRDLLHGVRGIIVFRGKLPRIRLVWMVAGVLTAVVCPSPPFSLRLGCSGRAHSCSLLRLSARRQGRSRQVRRRRCRRRLVRASRRRAARDDGSAGLHRAEPDLPVAGLIERGVQFSATPVDRASSELYQTLAARSVRVRRRRPGAVSHQRARDRRSRRCGRSIPKDVDGHLQRRGRRGRGQGRSPGDRRFPQGARPVCRDWRTDSARHPARRPSRHGQDAAGAVDGRRSGRAVHLGQRIGLRRDVRRRRRGPRAAGSSGKPAATSPASSSSTSSTPSDATAAARHSVTKSASRRSTSCSSRWTASRAPTASSSWRPPTAPTSSIRRCSGRAASIVRSWSAIPI